MKKINYFKTCNELVNELNNSEQKYFAIIDEFIYNNYPKFIKSIKGIKAFNLIVANESNKSLEMYKDTIDCMLFNEISSDYVVLNIGGGIVTDLGGFVCATYKRGLKFINIPTTLIGQIDASIGCKNGINHDNIKNTIGTYKEPQNIMICEEFLKTLPNEEITSGKIEMLKIALALNKDLLCTIEKPISLNTIKKFANLKLKICKEDMYCESIRNILNYGHTLGHAYEVLLDIPHGIAVGLGMYAIEDKKYKQEIKDYLEKTGLNINDYLPLLKNIDSYEIMKKIRNDKKVSNQEIKIITLDEIGKASIKRVSYQDLEKRIQYE